MNRLLRVYYAGIFGALAALIAWRITESLVVTGDIYAIQAAIGAVIGGVIGAVLLSTDEWVTNRSLMRGMRGLFQGAALGAAGGAGGLALGELVFQQSEGELLGRVAGWAVFGMAIGAAQTLSGGLQILKGLFGGLLGGSTGGLVLELSATSLQDNSWGEALSLMAVGAAVGLVTSAVITWLASAWLEIESGPMRGRTYFLEKYAAKKKRHGAVLGSDPWKVDIHLDGDPGVCARHAMIRRIEDH